MDYRTMRSEVIRSMDDIEFRAEAKRRGYRLVIMARREGEVL